MIAGTTRRALIAGGGAVALSAAAFAGSVPPIGNAQRWDMAFAEWQRTSRHARSEGSNAAYDAQSAAWLVLIKMPAPTQRDLLWKLDQILEVEGDNYSAEWPREIVSAVMGDAQRMLGGAA